MSAVVLTGKSGVSGVEFQIPDTFLSSYALTIEGEGVLFEYVADNFDINSDKTNFLYYTRKKAEDKYGKAERQTVPQSTIARIYKHQAQHMVAQKMQDSLVVEDESVKKVLSESTDVFLDVIRYAYQEKATDVHWVIRGNSATILFRIHGRIERIDRFQYNRNFAVGLLSAIYSSSLDVTDSSFSPRQRSACSLVYKNPPLMVRWQTVPTGDATGEGFDVILRLIKQETDNGNIDNVPSLESLGYLPDQVEMLTGVCGTSGGIFLSGMTGSGKTTALRSLMKIVRGKGSKKIYTIEDPVELKIYGATQISGRGHNVAEILHSLLRADPDTVMVGEIRNNAIASVMESVIRSGHQMLTTIHAPSALGVLARLSSEDIGLKRDTLAEPGFISALVYQCLMPKLCVHCRLPLSRNLDQVSHISRYLFDENFYGLDPSKMYIRNPSGCNRCRNGISEMTICAEVIRPTYEINELIRNRSDAMALMKYREMRRSKFTEIDTLGKTVYEVAIYKSSVGEISPIDVDDMMGKMSLQTIVPIDFSKGVMI